MSANRRQFLESLSGLALVPLIRPATRIDLDALQPAEIVEAARVLPPKNVITPGRMAEDQVTLMAKRQGSTLTARGMLTRMEVTLATDIMDVSTKDSQWTAYAAGRRHVEVTVTMYCTGNDAGVVQEIFNL